MERADKGRFQRLLHEFSEAYTSSILWLRFLLYDHVSISRLSLAHLHTMDLLNNMVRMGYISSDNVELLCEIAEVTQLTTAKKVLQEYKVSIAGISNQYHSKNSIQSLSRYRTALFRCLREVSMDEIHTIVAFYQLENYQSQFSTIWDLVFFLENQNLLSSNRRDVDAFGQLLNKTASEILKGYIKDEDKPIPPEVWAEGPEYVNAYIDALKDGKKKVYQTRLMLVGAENVGKTSLVNALIGKPFNKQEAATDGIDKDKTVTIKNIVNWKPAEVENAEKQRVNEIAKRIAKKYLQLISLKPQRFMNEINIENVKQLVQDEIPRHEMKPEEEISVAVPEVFLKRVLELLTRVEGKNMPVKLEDETFDDLKINIWDFAGQHVYYNTHQLFLVSRAIYLLCFKLNEDLDAKATVRITEKMSGTDTVYHLTNMEFIDFWLGTIYASTEETKTTKNQDSPPVFIVGTHKDELPGNTEEERQTCADEILDKVKDKLASSCYNKHVAGYYAIDNAPRPLDKQIEHLRKHITEVAKDEPYMGQLMPIKWLSFLQSIEEMRNNTKFMKFEEVDALAAKFEIVNENELSAMLFLYHRIGHLVYYGTGKREQCSELDKIVVLDPNWLIEVFRLVFTPKTSKKISLKELKEHGLLRESVLKQLWKDFIGIFNSILLLMMKFDLLTEKNVQGEGERIFYVPSMLNKDVKADEEYIDELVEGESRVTLYIDFGNFLPEGLFYRLVVRLLQWSESKGGIAKLLFQQVSLQVDKNHNILVRIVPQKRSSIQVIIMTPKMFKTGRTDADPPGQVKPEACNNVVALLYSTLNELIGIWMNKSIDFEFRIPCSNLEMEQHSHELKELLDPNNDSVQCGDLIHQFPTKMTKMFFGGCRSFLDIIPEKDIKSLPMDHFRSIGSNSQRFQEFKQQFSEIFHGDKIRFLLYKHLDVEALTRAVSVVGLLDELCPHHISYSDVNLLSEISELTQNLQAKILVKKYINATDEYNAVGDTRLSDYRKELFNALMKTTKVDLEELVNKYNLHDYGVDNNIWDLVFYLEKEKLLADTPDKIEKFGKCLNEHARSKLLENRKIPIEIIAEGPAAVEAYKKAKEDGSKPFYQTRLMVVGQERVGKTSLIKALTGKGFDKEEQITDGVNAELSVNTTHTTGWKINSEDFNIAQQDLDEALETNIAIGLQKEQREKIEYQGSLTDKPKLAVKSAFKDPEVPSSQEKSMITKDVDDQRTTSEDIPVATENVGEPDKVSTKTEKEHADQCATVEYSKSDSKNVSEIREGVEEEEEEKDEKTGNETLIDKAVRKVKNCPNFEQIEWCKDLILSIWDFAGQDLYYITHQVFLVSRAIYIICFNLCHGLDDYAEIEIHKLEHGKVTFEHHMTNVEFIFFWLRSVHSTTIQSANRQQSPAVIIVGTHRESLPGNAEEKLLCAKKKLEAIKGKLKGTTYEYLVDEESYFAIDNSLRPVDKAIEELKTYITDLAMKQSYMGDEIPVKWLEFFAKVEQLRKTNSTIKFNEVKELAEACAIEYDALYTVLKFSHKLGYIVYYGEPDTEGSALNDLVILDRNWLIKIFRKVFTYIRDPEWDKFESSWKRLSTEGIMEERLLRHLLTVPKDDDKQFKSFLELMQEFHLLLEIKDGTGTHKKSDRCFYVPSLLNDKQRKVMVDKKGTKSVVMLYIGFEGFLSEGMFYRLLVMLLKWSQDNGGEAKLFHHQGQFSVDDSHEMILSLWSFKRMFIQVAILRRASVGGYDKGKTEPSSKICERVPGFLKGKLDDLFKTYIKRKIDYNFFFLCNACNKEKKLIDCLKTDKIECEKTGMIFTKKIHEFFGGLELEQDNRSGTKVEPTTSVRALSTIVVDDGSSTEGKEESSTSTITLSPRTEAYHSEDKERPSVRLSPTAEADHLSTSEVEEEPSTSTETSSTTEADRPSTSEVEEGPSTSARTLIPRTAADQPSTLKDKERRTRTLSTKTAADRPSTSEKALSPTTDPELKELEVVVKPSQISTGRNVIDADGGFLTDGKTRLEIKSDAINKEEHVKVSVKNSFQEERSRDKKHSFQNLVARVSPIVLCGPSCHFNNKFTLKFQHIISNIENYKFSLYWKNCGSNKWEKIADEEDEIFTVEKGFCIVKTDHFSGYAVFSSLRKLSTKTKMFNIDFHGMSLTDGYQIKTVICKIGKEKGKEKTKKKTSQPAEEENWLASYQFLAVKKNSRNMSDNSKNLNIECIPTEGWSVNKPNPQTIHPMLFSGSPSRRFRVKADDVSNPQPCDVTVKLTQEVREMTFDYEVSLPEINEHFHKRQIQRYSQEDPSRTDERKQRYRDFLFQLSEGYPSSECLHVRFLLGSHLTIDELDCDDITTMHLFNLIKKKKIVSPDNVQILSEIAHETDNAFAKECIEKYKDDNPCIENKGSVLPEYRTELFKALKQIDRDGVIRIKDYYDVRMYEFKNKWDLVFYLEKEKILTDSKDEWQRFKRCLNKKAADKMR